MYGKTYNGIISLFAQCLPGETVMCAIGVAVTLLSPAMYDNLLMASSLYFAQCLQCLGETVSIGVAVTLLMTSFEFVQCSVHCDTGIVGVVDIVGLGVTLLPWLAVGES